MLGELGAVVREEEAVEVLADERLVLGQRAEAGGGTGSPLGLGAWAGDDARAQVMVAGDDAEVVRPPFVCGSLERREEVPCRRA